LSPKYQTRGKGLIGLNMYGRKLIFIDLGIRRETTKIENRNKNQIEP
jgi:hypothetical protein